MGQSVFLVSAVLLVTIIIAPTNALVAITPELNVFSPSAYYLSHPTTLFESRGYKRSQTHRTALVSPSKKCTFLFSAIAERSLCETESYDVHNLQNKSSTDLPRSELASDQAVCPLTQRPTLSVVAGTGAIITSVSNGAHMERVISHDYAKEISMPSLTVFPGRGARITAVSSGVTVNDRAVSNQTRISSRSDVTSKKQTILPAVKSLVDTNRMKRVGRVGELLSSIRSVAAASASGSTNNYLKAGRGQSASHFDWKSNIQSTVSQMLLLGQTSLHGNNDLSDPHLGVLHESSLDLPRLLPRPGTILVRDSRNSKITGRQITIRSSVPHSADDMFIANLRLSVFSNFDKEKQDIFRSRSLEVLNVRRRRGAVVLVAEMPLEGVTNAHCRNELDARVARGRNYGTTSIASEPTLEPKKNSALRSNIIGSVECSQHEFHRTILGNLRPENSLLYITEVAVCPEARRCGAGMMLMKGVDKVAALRNVESIYLHVDVTNSAACAMYEKAGYEKLDKSHPMYAQFTASLNLHDGALMGRCHYLMCKNRTEKTTWLDNNHLFSDKTGEQ